MNSSTTFDNNSIDSSGGDNYTLVYDGNGNLTDDGHL